MVFGHKAPIARVDRIIAVIAQYKIVVHLKSVSIGRLSIDQDFTFFFLDIVTFKIANYSLNKIMKRWYCTLYVA